MLLVAILVTTISSLILNYRIGIEVNSGLLGIIFNPLLQQGASFETVYGALKYNEKILSCISYYDYFLQIKISVLVLTSLVVFILKKEEVSHQVFTVS